MFATPQNMEEFARDDAAAWEAVRACESILEKHPHDPSALSGLAASYEKIGNASQAWEIYMRLAEVFEEEQNWSQLYSLAQHLLTLNPDDPEAERLLEVSENPADALLGTENEEVEPSPSEAQLEFNLNAEIDLAWLLLQNEMISSEQYEAAISGITESRMNTASESTLSLMHELESMDKVDINAIIGFLSAHTATPFVELERFEIPEEAFALVPFEHARRLGIIPFAQMSSQWQVAVLNPLQTGFQQTLEEFTGDKVHLFITSPASMQRVIQSAGERLKTVT